jgi:hypothetical protein
MILTVTLLRKYFSTVIQLLGEFSSVAFPRDFASTAVTRCSILSRDLLKACDSSLFIIRKLLDMTFFTVRGTIDIHDVSGVSCAHQVVIVTYVMIICY